MDFQDQTIVVAVAGGIAAYKACDLIRELYRLGAKRVIPLLSSEGAAFVTPLTLQSLSREKVYTDPRALMPDGTPVHIALAQQADALLILPATANLLARLAMGMADDLLTTTALTFTGKPVILAPAMNVRMWNNPLVQQNCKILQSLAHVSVVAPTAGLLACGETGEGHLAPTHTIIRAVYRAIHPHANLYQGIRAVVTAGGTQTPIDAARVLTNRSSGKMGLALADELHAMGATVSLLTAAEPPEHRPYSVERVSDPETLYKTLHQGYNNMDLLIMAAAVSDYQVANPTGGKLKKRAVGETLNLTLTPTVDILASLGARRQQEAASKAKQPRLVGFAAESENLLTYAREKLHQKQLDAIVANAIHQPGIGFGANDNEVTLLFQSGTAIALDRAPKWQIARQLLVHLHPAFWPQPATRASHSLTCGNTLPEDMLLNPC
ncbi:MAG: bifunctional phosphopantothenoylcysteine decarboxylase/phosphopantothenate--cysteine ligase CoaBC [Candidatus Melainabacteria bacterium]|nr:bifunctional phosphopantothenoylcysteine decarboxylase/phosphopantothenate--cysteine ligase CoaBC [Candidatus Melainabacteria bacterium]